MIVPSIYILVRKYSARRASQWYVAPTCMRIITELLFHSIFWIGWHACEQIPPAPPPQKTIEHIEQVSKQSVFELPATATAAHAANGTTIAHSLKNVIFQFGITPGHGIGRYGHFRGGCFRFEKGGGWLFLY